MLVDRGVDLEESVFWNVSTEDHGFDTEGTPLYRACRFGQVETAKYLLDNGANGFAQDEAGRSCFFVAQERNHGDILRLLKAYGIDS